MKKFLKERGGADIYPSVEVTWRRGHDPEIEVRECNGEPPSSQLGPGGPQPIIKIGLSPFSTDQIHYLLQCHGIYPGSKAPISTPRAATSAKACEKLPEVLERGWWPWIGGAMLVVIPGLIFCRWGASPFASAVMHPSMTIGSKMKRKSEDCPEGIALGAVA